MFAGIYCIDMRILFLFLILLSLGTGTVCLGDVHGGGRFVLLPAETRAEAGVVVRRLMCGHKDECGFLRVFLVSVKEQLVEEVVNGNGGLGDNVVSAKRLGYGMVKVVRRVKEEEIGEELVLLGYKRKVKPGEYILVKTRLAGIYRKPEGGEIGILEAVR